MRTKLGANFTPLCFASLAVGCPLTVIRFFEFAVWFYHDST
jgi:hypothetical protein